MIGIGLLLEGISSKKTFFARVILRQIIEKIK